MSAQVSSSRHRPAPTGLLTAGSPPQPLYQDLFLEPAYRVTQDDGVEGDGDTGPAYSPAATRRIR